MNEAELKAFFKTNTESRRMALQDAVLACAVFAANEGDAFGDYDAGFEAGVRACMDAIKGIMPDEDH